MEAKLETDIEVIRQMRVSVPVPDPSIEGRFKIVEVPMISSEERAMIDNMLL
jgi:hypothetical protein